RDKVQDFRRVRLIYKRPEATTDYRCGFCHEGVKMGACGSSKSASLLCYICYKCYKYCSGDPGYSNSKIDGVIHGLKRASECAVNRPDPADVVTIKPLRFLLRGGQWPLDEDRQLIMLVQRYGAQNWVKVSQNLRSRSSRHCRERFHELTSWTAT